MKLKGLSILGIAFIVTPLAFSTASATLTSTTYIDVGEVTLEKYMGDVDIDIDLHDVDLLIHEQHRVYLVVNLEFIDDDRPASGGIVVQVRWSPSVSGGEYSKWTLEDEIDSDDSCTDELSINISDSLIWNAVEGRLRIRVAYFADDGAYYSDDDSCDVEIHISSW